VGIDNSAEMIAFALQAFPADAFGNLRFQQADARDLPFVVEFDWVLSEKVRRSLRLGGGDGPE